MIFLNEWLPNPVGPDAAGEFVELYNNATTTAILRGWRLGTGTATTTSDGAQAIVAARTKPSLLTGVSVPGGGYRVLRHGDDGLSLKNTDGAVLLYGPDGTVADAAAFAGSAPEGKSFSRIGYGAGGGQRFVFTDPTPGAANAPVDDAVHALYYPEGVPLNPKPTGTVIAVSALGLAALIALSFVYALKKSDHLSHLVFGRDEDPRRGICRRSVPRKTKHERSPSCGPYGRTWRG